MKKFKTIQAGSRFGKLTVVGVGSNVKNKNGEMASTSICMCDCGREKEIRNWSLKSHATKSCGCLQKARATETHRTHGETVGYEMSPEYEAWASIIQRVRTTGGKTAKHYGARGICMCDRWRNSFTTFLSDMGRRPTANHSIDRVDVNGDYEPSNCRWATRAEQSVNKRTTLRFTFYGHTLLLRQWASISRVRPNTIVTRLARGWSTQKAVWTQPKPMRQRELMEVES